jgi:hypothetical protein
VHACLRDPCHLPPHLGGACGLFAAISAIVIDESHGYLPLRPLRLLATGGHEPVAGYDEIGLAHDKTSLEPQERRRHRGRMADSSVGVVHRELLTLFDPRQGRLYGIHISPQIPTIRARSCEPAGRGQPIVPGDAIVKMHEPYIRGFLREEVILGPA